MRKVVIAAAALALATVAHAADKGGPPATLEEIIALRQSPLSGCYAETSVAGLFLAQGDRKAAGSIGLGCDARLDRVVIGGGFRADMGDSTATAGSAYLKLGLALNPHLHLYGLGAWVVPDWKIRDVGQLHLGAGVETSVLWNGVSAFVEGTTAVSKFGAAASRDDIVMRLGARYRF